MLFRFALQKSGFLFSFCKALEMLKKSDAENSIKNTLSLLKVLGKNHFLTSGKVQCLGAVHKYTCD